MDQPLPANRTLLPEQRRQRVAARIRATGGVTVAALEAEFGVSAMTARRDLEALEQEGQARRIHGGAVRPESAGHEDSFQARLARAVPAKERLATAALGLLRPGGTVFLDSSTTAYLLARRLVADGPPVTVLTNSLPVMDLVAGVERPGLELIGMGGSFRRLTRSFVGPQAVRAVAAHVADLAFLSVKGLTPAGHLTDPDPQEAEVKRAMVAHARCPVLLVDGAKLGDAGLNVVGDLAAIAVLLAADAPEEAVRALPTGGAEVRLV